MTPTDQAVAKHPSSARPPHDVRRLWRIGLSIIAAIPMLASILGAGTHPFIPGHLAQGVGQLVAAVGFAGASLALLRTPKDGSCLPANDR